MTIANISLPQPCRFSFSLTSGLGLNRAQISQEVQEEVFPLLRTKKNRLILIFYFFAPRML